MPFGTPDVQHIELRLAWPRKRSTTTTKQLPTLPSRPKSCIGVLCRKACVHEFELNTILMHRDKSLGDEKQPKLGNAIGHCDRIKNWITQRLSPQQRGFGTIVSIININNTPVAEGLALSVPMTELLIIALIAYATAIVSRHIRKDATEANTAKRRCDWNNRKCYRNREIDNITPSVE